MGATGELNINLARGIAEKGGKCVLVTNSDKVASGGRLLVIRQPVVPEILSPLLDILPVQLAANYFAEERRFVPGKFRWSSKVTLEEY